jgi:hypothetical protein
MAMVVARAMALEHAKLDVKPDCNATAERMIASRKAFVDDGDLMRHFGWAA